jgi:hypothetical protein
MIYFNHLRYLLPVALFVTMLYWCVPQLTAQSTVQAQPSVQIQSAQLFLGNALDVYHTWLSPTVIVSDGAYGIGGFEGDPSDVQALPEWYEPHIKAWSQAATGQTTLWFWNTEIGWATVHPLLLAHGWEYRGCNVWDKGIGHIAGNSNTKTLRKFPVVTEICAQYSKAVSLPLAGIPHTLQQWLRAEWLRTGLPLAKTNLACGVVNAASRKYFTTCHLWYFPPVEMFQKFVAYANLHGEPSGRPYFSLDGVAPLSGEEWATMRSKFKLEHGITNVWSIPTVRGAERLKNSDGVLHQNQKPYLLTERLILASSDVGDVIWEPFGGLGTTSLAALINARTAYYAEISDTTYHHAVQRLEHESERLF